MKEDDEEKDPKDYVEIISHGSEYDILNKHTGSHGLVWVTTNTIEDYRENSHLWEILSKDHEESEKVAEIQQFYPHGNEDEDNPPIAINQGIGTYVLSHVLTDLVNRGIKIVYSFNPSNCFSRRLKKQGFQELETGTQKELYKVIV